MAAVVEGVDDEVLFTFLFVVVSCVLVAVVFLRSRRNNSLPAATRESATATGTVQTDHSTPDFGTQTNSSTEQVHVQAREAGADSYSEGIRRRFGARDNSSDLSRPQNTAATTTSDSATTDTASCGGSVCASKSNDLTNTAAKNLSDNTNNSFSHGTSSNTDTGPSTASSHGSNSGPSTAGSLGADMDPSTTSSHGTSTDSGRTVTIRVKYQETERSFTVDMFMKIQELKRLCFPSEISQGRTVRLIYSGRLLVNDEATLSYYGIGNYSVIHAQISNASQSSQSQQGQQQIDDSDIDMGQIFLPLLTIILCGCWYGLISYRNLFSTMSAAILVVLTGAYTVVAYAMIG